MESSFEDEFLPLHSMLEVSLVEENGYIDPEREDPFGNLPEVTPTEDPLPGTSSDTSDTLEPPHCIQPVPLLDIQEDELNFYETLFKDISIVKYLRIHCTICDAHIGCAPQSSELLFYHRILRVAVCMSCYTFYGSGDFAKGDDGSDIYCRWCGQGGQLMLCSNCPNGFCKKCIKCNYTPKVLKEILSSPEWLCFVCNYRALWEHRALCWAANRYIKWEKEQWNAGTLRTLQWLGPEKPAPGFDKCFCCQIPPDTWAKKVRHFHSSMPNEVLLTAIANAAEGSRRFERVSEENLIKELSNNTLEKVSTVPENASINTSTPNQILLSKNSALSATNSTSASKQYYLTNTNEPMVQIPRGTGQVPNAIEQPLQNSESPQNRVTKSRNDLNSPQNRGTTSQTSGPYLSVNPLYQSGNSILMTPKHVGNAKNRRVCTPSTNQANYAISSVISNHTPTASIGSGLRRVNRTENCIPVPVMNLNSGLKVAYANAQTVASPNQLNHFVYSNRYLNNGIPETNVRGVNRLPTRGLTFAIAGNRIIRLIPSQRVIQNRDVPPPVIDIDNDTDPISTANDIDPLNTSRLSPTDSDVCIVESPATIDTGNQTNKAESKLKTSWLRSSLQNAAVVSKNMGSHILDLSNKYEALVNQNDVNGLNVLTKKLCKLYLKVSESIVTFDSELREKQKKWSTDYAKRTNPDVRIDGKKKANAISGITAVNNSDVTATQKSNNDECLDMEISYASDHDSNSTISCEQVINPTETSNPICDWGSLSDEEEEPNHPSLLESLLSKKYRARGDGKIEDVRNEGSTNETENAKKFAHNETNDQLLRKLLLDDYMKDGKSRVSQSTNTEAGLDCPVQKPKCSNASVQTNIGNDSEWSGFFDQFISKLDKVKNTAVPPAKKRKSSHTSEQVEENRSPIGSDIEATEDDSSTATEVLSNSTSSVKLACSDVSDNNNLIAAKSLRVQVEKLKKPVADEISEVSSNLKRGSHLSPKKQTLPTKSVVGTDSAIDYEPKEQAPLRKSSLLKNNPLFKRISIRSSPSPRRSSSSRRSVNVCQTETEKSAQKCKKTERTSKKPKQLLRNPLFMKECSVKLIRLESTVKKEPK